jgi:ParB/RepB/Spo0J family partition protein
MPAPEANAPEVEVVFGERERRSARNIAIKELFLGELNERLDPGDIEGLARSIRQVGVLEPLLVRPVGDRFEVIAGGRRLRAASLAGVESVPCVSKVMDDVTALKASFHENEERKSASPLEYGMLCWKLAQRCETLKEVGELLGKSQAWVESRINAYELYKKANVRLTEKGPGGKRLEDVESVEPSLGLVDANQIMQFVASPKVRRYYAQVGGDVEERRTMLVRDISENYPKLTPIQRRRLLRELRKDPSVAVGAAARKILAEPNGIKVSLSFNAEVSSRIMNAVNSTGETVESWLRRLVIQHLDLDRKRAGSSEPSKLVQPGEAQ